MSKKSFPIGADDKCGACGKEVATQECPHGMLCDKCYEEIHGSVHAHCAL